MTKSKIEIADEIANEANKLALESYKNKLTVMGFILAASILLFTSNNIEFSQQAEGALLVSLLTIIVAIVLHLIHMEVAWKQKIRHKNLEESETMIERYKHDGKYVDLLNSAIKNSSSSEKNIEILTWVRDSYINNENGPTLPVLYKIARELDTATLALIVASLLSLLLAFV